MTNGSHVRCFGAVAEATAFEVISEPLTLLILTGALVLATLAPAFHYHQFGEATRMARDAGFSALFVSSVLIGVFGALRSFRREFETGTAQMALVHPISRAAFFLAKCLGVALATAGAGLVVVGALLTIVNGAAIGGVIADRTGAVARIWGPSLALGLGTFLAPLILSAALNRLARFRFVPTAFVLMLVFAAGSVTYRADFAEIARLTPGIALALLPSFVILSAAAAFSVRFKANAAASCIAGVAPVALPALGNYCLTDALARGGSIPLAYFTAALLAALPALLAFLLLGCDFSANRDIDAD